MHKKKKIFPLAFHFFFCCCWRFLQPELFPSGFLPVCPEVQSVIWSIVLTDFWQHLFYSTNCKNWKWMSYKTGWWALPYFQSNACCVKMLFTCSIIYSLGENISPFFLAVKGFCTCMQKELMLHLCCQSLWGKLPSQQMFWLVFRVQSLVKQLPGIMPPFI